MQRAAFSLVIAAALMYRCHLARQTLAAVDRIATRLDEQAATAVMIQQYVARIEASPTLIRET